MNDPANSPQAGVREVAFPLALTAVPQTDPERLGQQLADHVAELPAAALIGQIEVPAAITNAVRSLASLHQTASSAADFLFFFVRLYYVSGEALPHDALAAATAARDLWERQLTGTASGLLGVALVPGLDMARAPFDIAEHTPWVVATSNPSPGLLPEGVNESDY